MAIPNRRNLIQNPDSRVFQMFLTSGGRGIRGGVRRLTSCPATARGNRQNGIRKDQLTLKKRTARLHANVTQCAVLPRLNS